MCFAVTCQTCNKQTWQGCGKHVESVMSKIPVEDRCTCKRDDNKKPETEKKTEPKKVISTIHNWNSSYTKNN
ncbi:unnamed protein product [Rhizophagus irregularis]|nr:unnamed protein product [Rhizophagus irregularis]CAB5358949.1 unnamed protein product [Rhizophagus irregularis]